MFKQCILLLSLSCFAHVSLRSESISPALCEKCQQSIEAHQQLSAEEKIEFLAFIQKTNKIHCHRGDLEGLQNGAYYRTKHAEEIYFISA